MTCWRSVFRACVLCVLLAGIPAGLASAAMQATSESGVGRADRLDQLFSELRNAGTSLEAQTIANRIWMIWTEAPDARGRETMKAIFAARRSRSLEKALALCEKITQRLPNYAEGWNQKATVLFEMGRFDRSLETVEKLLALEPRHFGALSGKAMILLRQGRVMLGQQALRRAVDIHPFLPERRFLVTPQDDAI